MINTNKVLLIGPSLAMGGIERAIVNTANGLCELGERVIFLSLFKKDHFFSLNSKIQLLEPSGFNEKSLNFIKSVNTRKIKQKRTIEKKAALSPDINTSITEERISKEILRKKYFLFSSNVKKDTITIGNILET